MKRVFTALAFALILLYPAVVYWGLTRFQPRVLALLLLGLFVLRLVSFSSLRGKELVSFLPTFAAIALVSIGVMWSNHKTWLLFYPVLLNIVLLGSFAWTLWRGPSMIERFARLQEPDLDLEGQRYCYRVTIVWCVFFVFNAATAAWLTLYSTVAVWTLYNGLISYLLIGSLLGGEWLYRKFFLLSDRELQGAGHHVENQSLQVEGQERQVESLNAALTKGKTEHSNSELGSTVV